MPSPVKLYQQEMRKRMGFFANWLPGDFIEIGAIGALSNGQFRRQTSLKELNIRYMETPIGQRQDIRYTSSSGVRIKSGVTAEVPMTGSAGLSIDFSEEGAFVFQALGMRQRQLGDRANVARAVLDLAKRNEWQREWVLIEALYVADCATIIVSESRGASVTLAADIAGPLPLEALADATIGLHVAASIGRMVQILCANKLRPLYNCVQLTRSWLPGSPLMLRTGSPPLQAVNIDQLLDS